MIFVVLFFKHEGSPIGCLTCEQWCKKHEIFKTWNVKILKITAKLSVMRGSPSETFENIFALYIPVKAATAVNVSVFSRKQGGMDSRRCHQLMCRFQDCRSHADILQQVGWFLPDTLKQHTAGTNIKSPSCSIKSEKPPLIVSRLQWVISCNYWALFFGECVTALTSL